MWVIGFVHPESGRTSFWIVPQLSAPIFALVLSAFAAEQGAGEGKRLLLVLDGAGFHTGNEVKTPPGIKLITLPPYSPELQPAERLWPLCNEPLANRSFKSINELEEVLSNQCCQLATWHDYIRALAFYHWWPSTTAPPTV